MGLLRLIAVIGGVSILAVVVLTAGATLMPGTKVRKLFGASAEALAGDGQGTGTRKTMKDFGSEYGAPPQPAQAMAADAGTPGGTDGGADAGTAEAAGR
jgi:hypothetical protein